MATKQMEEKKRNRLIEILAKEYKWENYLLLFVAIIALALATMILTGELVPDASFPVIGSYPAIFAWVLLGVSLIGLGLVLWPFIKSVIPEFKKITWATWKEFFDNAVKVLLFVVILAAFFLLTDSFIQYLMKRISEIF